MFKEGGSWRVRFTEQTNEQMNRKTDKRINPLIPGNGNAILIQQQILITNSQGNV